MRKITDWANPRWAGPSRAGSRLDLLGYSGYRGRAVRAATIARALLRAPEDPLREAKEMLHRDRLQQNEAACGQPGHQEVQRDGRPGLDRLVAVPGWRVRSGGMQSKCGYHGCLLQGRVESRSMARATLACALAAGAASAAVAARTVPPARCLSPHRVLQPAHYRPPFGFRGSASLADRGLSVRRRRRARAVPRVPGRRAPLSNRMCKVHAALVRLVAWPRSTWGLPWVA